MTYYLVVLAFVVLAVIQGGVGPVVMNVKPDLVLLGALSWGLVRGVKEGLVIAFLGALAVGIFSNGPLGGGVLAMVVAALLPWLRETRLGENRLTLGLGIAFGGTLVFYSLYWFASQLVGRGGGDWYSSLTVIALPAAFLNVIVMPVLYGPLQWVGQRV